MGFGDVWNRTLVYFGIAEEDEDWDEDGYVTNEELERSYSERPNVRRLSPRRRRNEFEDWTDPEPQQGGGQTAVLRPRPRPSRATMRPTGSMTAEIPVFAARTNGRPCSMARSRACCKC